MIYECDFISVHITRVDVQYYNVFFYDVSKVGEYVSQCVSHMPYFHNSHNNKKFGSDFLSETQVGTCK